MLSWYPYAKLSQLDRISCETFRRPSLSPTPHPGRRACRTRHTEHHHARPRLCHRLRPTGQDGPRWLARQQQRLPGRHAGRAPLGMGLRVPPDPLVLHKGLAIRIRQRHLLRAYGHARGRRNRPHAQHLVFGRARAEAALFLEPRGHRALLHLRQARSRRPCQRRPPGAPRPYHRLQRRRYANYRRPAVARRRRRYLHL